MSRNFFETAGPRFKKKIVNKRTLRAEALENRALLSVTATSSSMQQMTASAITSSSSLVGATILANAAPRVVTAAAAAANPVTGANTQLSVLGADDGGEIKLKYTWAATTIPSGAAAPIFSANATNTSKNTTVTFKAAGTYTFTVTIKDAGNLAITSSVTVTVNPTFTSIGVSPATPVLFTGTKQLFTASALDQFGKAMAVQPAFTWTANSGTITALGLFTTPNTNGTATITAASGTIRGSTSVQIVGAPTVSKPATASASIVTGTSVQLSVLGAATVGESKLKYTWAATTLPIGATAPIFSANGTNAAKNTTVSFKKAGTYIFTVTILDPGNLSVTSNVTVTVQQTLSRINANPLALTLLPGASQQFIVTGADQFGDTMQTQPTFVWTATTGTITATGLYTAPVSYGTGTVTVASGTIKCIAKITTANKPPMVVTAAAAANKPVTGTTTVLSVLGGDDGGESNLKYTWSVKTLPNGVTAPIFSVNDNNNAKFTVVTFSAAGTYVFTATITDGYNLSIASNVTVVVAPTLTSISMTPSTSNLYTGTTQQFTALGIDQFGKTLDTQPNFVWSATAGTIDNSGLFTTPGAAGNASIMATSGGVQGTASVVYTVNNNFLGLNDPALAGLTQSLVADGSIDRLDMIQILRSTGVGGSVSTADFSDLKTIIRDAAALNMPDFVKVLASDVVNGNFANAFYQGQRLDNLTAGSSAAKLNNLIDKWFFGGDHPTIDANIPSGQTFTYRTASGSLFSGNPTHLDEFQGMLGDCYFITALGTVADKSPAAIQNMFLDNGDGTWTVRFYANGTADYVTVDRMLPTDAGGNLVYADFGSAYNNAADTLWIPLAEKAYAQWNETGNEGRNGTNTYSGIEAGNASTVYTQVLGRPAAGYYPLGSAQVMIDAINNNLAVAISTSSSINYGLYANHSYGVIGYDSFAGTFTLFNPWGTNQPPAALTWAQLQETCSGFQTADPTGTVPLGTVPASAPLSRASMLAPSAATDSIRMFENALDSSKASVADRVSVLDGNRETRPAAYQAEKAAESLFAEYRTESSDLLPEKSAVKSVGNFGADLTPLEIHLMALDELLREALA